MSTITELTHSLHSWMRRLRLQRAFTWAWRGLIVGLGSSLILGVIGLYRSQLLQGEFLTLVVSLSLFTPLIFGLTGYLWRIRLLEAARHFDLLFHLQERVSTALELNQHPGHIPPQLLHRQLEDAVTAARSVDPNGAFTPGMKFREGLFALLFAILIGLVWFRGDAWFQAAQQAHAVKQAVEEQTAKIEEIIKQIEADEVLTDEQKQVLTEPLKEAQQSLQNNPSLENSVSVLTRAGEKLQELSDPQSQELSEALKAIGEQLAGQEGSPLQSLGQELAQGNAVNAATELANTDVSQLSAEEQAQLAGQLQAMADSLQSTNPELASQLNQAAEVLQNGDTEAAQQALDNAAQSLAQAGQQIAASQAAQHAAGQMQQGAGQVLATGGGQAQQATQSGQGQDSNQGSQTNGSGGSGSGSGSDAGQNPTGSEAGSDPIAQNNGPGDGGESSYEQIYAPQLLGGDGGPQVDLPSSDQSGGDVIGQGLTTPGEPGSSTVPYDEVYSQYEQINNQAIEHGDIPPSFMQIIKNYFDSLKP